MPHEPPTPPVEIEADLIGNLPEVLAVEQLDRMGVVVLLEAVGVLLSRVREPAGRDDHSAFGAVEVERRDRTKWQRGRSTSSR